MQQRARRWMVAATATVAATLGLAACSGGADMSAAVAESMQSAAAGSGDTGSGTESDSQADMAYGEAPSNEAPSNAAPAEAASVPGQGSTERAGESGTGAANIGPLPSDRQIIRTAEVTVTISVPPGAKDDEIEGDSDGNGHDGTRRVASPEALAAAAANGARAVRALVTLPGGYVAGSDGRGSTITVTLRIPAGAYETVMDRLGDIGTTTDRAESTVDVTGDMIDVASRIASQQASVDRLRALMTEAKSMQDVISIESELSRREADLESLQQRRASMADSVALSTISVTVTAIPLREPVTVTEPGPPRSAFMTGLAAGWHGLTAVGRTAATVLGGLLPFFPLLLLAAGGAWYLARRNRRRSDGAASRAEVVPTADIGQV